MSKTWALIRRELSAYFLSPAAYVVLAIFLLLSGYFFSTYVISARQADMRPVLGNMAVIFLFLVPALTARLWSEELKQGTDEFLMTAPIATRQIVIAKYLASLLLFALFLAVTFTYPVVLEIWGQPDWRAILTGYLGLLLVGGAALAVGLYASSLTDSQMVAAMIAFAMLLGFWIISWAADALPPSWQPVLEYLSLTDHFYDFSKGILDTKHGVYFLSLIGGFLFLTTQRLETARTR
jgi:ABC-2 type transport system permease protein